MLIHRLVSKIKVLYFEVVLLLMLIAASCTVVKNAPVNRPYIGKNSIEVKGGNFSKIEKSAVIDRLTTQLDDSATFVTKDIYLFKHKILNPPAFDTSYANISAKNMEASLFHLGYYHANATYKADTGKSEHTSVLLFGLPISTKKTGKKVGVHYTVDAGKQTLIDTVSYRLRNPDLQQIALENANASLLNKRNPITKIAVLSEISRLVDTFRNNGYYKFTAAELRVRADTTIAALTTISDDPFEQLQLLAEAQQQRDSPKVKLAVVLNIPDDTTKLNKYTIGDIYLLPDYRPGDNLQDTINIKQRIIYLRDAKGNPTNTKRFILRNHEKLFRTGFLSRNLALKSGDIFRQDDYYNTINNFTNKAVWQSVNIQVADRKDSSNKVDLIAELIPSKKFGFEEALELSYSASNNVNNVLAGNLFGISANLSLVNRNVAKEGIKMTHSFRAGVELNNNRNKNNSNKLINSNELSYSNSIVFPKVLQIFPEKKRRYVSGQSFINTGFTYNNRLNLFNLQSFNFNLGNSKVSKKGHKYSLRPFNVEFSYLFNESDSFKTIINDNPFLRYSYNTAFIIGTSASYFSSYKNPKHLFSVSKQRDFTANAEESGITWGLLPILNKYKRKYIKLDAEYKYTVTYSKTALAFRLFGGVGIPLGNDSIKTLPFFKQYFGGGSNSMRGWPVRGIGRGGERLIPFDPTKYTFNDRTGDMRLEGNVEYRYDIARIIPNTLTLRGALFVDAGNIWNIKDLKPAGITDSAQFKLKNLYKQLGVSAGTGFRLDFNYFILRLDLGFRFKRPELSYINDGWKIPSIGFDDVLKKLFSKSQRQWRYENFNFTIGISYPF
ncbi:MAG: BamA/TamA family outer membrane protein [Bacteroidetes bacterium]|nr:BamA/TamA family outer membrane protein [Bacteroidota bacterium]